MVWLHFYEKYSRQVSNLSTLDRWIAHKRHHSSRATHSDKIAGGVNGAKKDPLLLDNWRPISLLNSDYKIFALILAKRLTSDSIDESQSGFMHSLIGYFK